MYVKVNVTPGARQEIFTEKKPGYFDAKIKEKAERNMANDRVIELVAEFYKVSKNKVRIINGHQHPSKLLVVDVVENQNR